VIQVQGIEIHTPLTRLKSGSIMPVWAEGIPDVLSPIIIGSVHPPLRFSWSVSAREVGMVQHVFEDFGLIIAEEDMVSMRFFAVSPGRTFLRMDVYLPPEMGGKVNVPDFHDSLEIEVFEELLLIHPPYSLTQRSPLLVLAPNSEVQLKTNRDGFAKEVMYSLGGRLLPTEHVSDNHTVSKALTDIDQFLTVEPAGLVRSHNQLGSSVIMVTAKEDFGVKQILSLSVQVSCVFLHAVDGNPDHWFHMKWGEPLSKDFVESLFIISLSNGRIASDSYITIFLMYLHTKWKMIPDLRCSPANSVSACG
jgi:nuclear pore complex protein Nup210